MRANVNEDKHQEPHKALHRINLIVLFVLAIKALSESIKFLHLNLKQASQPNTYNENIFSWEQEPTGNCSKFYHKEVQLEGDISGNGQPVRAGCVSDWKIGNKLPVYYKPSLYSLMLPEPELKCHDTKACIEKCGPFTSLPNSCCYREIGPVLLSAPTLYCLFQYKDTRADVQDYRGRINYAANATGLLEVRAMCYVYGPQKPTEKISLALNAAASKFKLASVSFNCDPNRVEADRRQNLDLDLDLDPQSLGVGNRSMALSLRQV